MGTGLKKCMPITLSARFVRAASLVIEIDDVLEARMISGRQRRSRSRNSSALISNFSVAASITKSQFEIKAELLDRKSTRLNSSHVAISYAVFCLKKNNEPQSPMLLLCGLRPD